MGPNNRDSMDSEERSWSSSRPLVTGADKEVEISTGYVAKRRTWSPWPFVLHALLFSAYSVSFLTAPRMLRMGDEALAYCRSAVSIKEGQEAETILPQLQRLQQSDFRKYHMRGDCTHSINFEASQFQNLTTRGTISFKTTTFASAKRSSR